MIYMNRLGIWGEGTPFRTFEEFLHAVEKRCVLPCWDGDVGPAGARRSHAVTQIGVPTVRPCCTGPHSARSQRGFNHKPCPLCPALPPHRCGKGPFPLLHPAPLSAGLCTLPSPSRAQPLRHRPGTRGCSGSPLPLQGRGCHGDRGHGHEGQRHVHRTPAQLQRRDLPRGGDPAGPGLRAGLQPRGPAGEPAAPHPAGPAGAGSPCLGLVRSQRGEQPAHWPESLLQAGVRT